MLAVWALPRARLRAAVGLTVVAFLILPGYDALGLRYVRHPLPAGKTILPVGAA